VKNSTVYIFAAAVGLFIALGAYQQGKLHADAAVSPAKIAVVNVTHVMKTCRQFKTWQETKQKEGQKIETELQAMQAELEALNANLKILNPGSEDHRKLVKEFIEKKATFQSKETTYKEVWGNEKELWTEQLYQKLLTVIDKVAAQKGLDIVIANEELDLKDPLRPDIMQTIVTKKVVYHNSQFDMTEEVLAAMDAED